MSIISRGWGVCGLGLDVGLGLDLGITRLLGRLELHLAVVRGLAGATCVPRNINATFSLHFQSSRTAVVYGRPAG